MRVVMIASAPPAAIGFGKVLSELGHEIPAVAAIRAPQGRYGPDYPLALHRVVPDADLFFMRSGERLGDLLRAYAADVALSATFPARILDDALDAPRHGVLNCHPGLLPRYRGPNPMGWALRNGEEEIGMTVHRMTNEFDAGPILAQGVLRIGSEEDPFSALQTNGPSVWKPLISEAFARIEAGDLGDPQDESRAAYAGVFEPAYVEVDRTLPARLIHDQTRAWRVAPPIGSVHGPLTMLNGRRVRLVQTRLDAAGGGLRMACGDGSLWVLQAEPVSDEHPQTRPALTEEKHLLANACCSLSNEAADQNCSAFAGRPDAGRWRAGARAPSTGGEL